MESLLVIALSLLIGFDAQMTHKRILEYGPEVELNPVFRALARRFGASGASISCILFNAALLATFWQFHWTLGMAFLLGVRTLYGLLQLTSSRRMS